jgi:hypothetical protein
MASGLVLMTFILSSIKIGQLVQMLLKRKTQQESTYICLFLLSETSLNLNSNSTKSTVHSKSKAVPLHTMKAHGGRGGIAPTHT